MTCWLDLKTKHQQNKRQYRCSNKKRNGETPVMKREGFSGGKSLGQKGQDALGSNNKLVPILPSASWPG